MHCNKDFFNPTMQQEVFDLIENIYFIDFSNKDNFETTTNQTNEITDNDIFKLNEKIRKSYLSEYTDVADFELKVNQALCSSL
jgi:hypothetical protein